MKRKKRKKLQMFRVKLDMSQEQFADKLGYSRGQYARIENGTNGVTLNFLDALCSAFKMELAEAKRLTEKDGK